jgi:ribonuclease Z
MVSQDQRIGCVFFSSNHAKTEDIQLRLQLYGPAGLRRLVRTNLQITQPNITGKYCAHELLRKGDSVTSCEPEDLHEHEDPGRDIHCDEDGLWRDFEDDDGIQVDAGPIEHRGVSSLIPISPRVHRNPVPCFGYVFKEKPKPRVTPQYLSMLDDIPRAHLPPDVWNPRYLLKDLRQGRGVTLENGEVIEPPEISSSGIKIVVLGDTSDASGVEPLAQNASLLVHESTNAYIPPKFQENPRQITNKTPESVREKAISRGHSTPDMAGAFARRINAKRLYMNHFSAKWVLRICSDPVVD